MGYNLSFGHNIISDCIFPPQFLKVLIFGRGVEGGETCQVNI